MPCLPQCCPPRDFTLETAERWEEAAEQLEASRQALALQAEQTLADSAAALSTVPLVFPAGDVQPRDREAARFVEAVRALRAVAGTWLVLTELLLAAAGGYHSKHTAGCISFPS